MPSWDGVKDVARRAAAAVPLGYLGCDVVVDEHRGPLILEINARPGLEIQNVHGYGLGRAIRGGRMSELAGPSIEALAAEAVTRAAAAPAPPARVPERVFDRLWPVLTGLGLLLAGAIVLEIVATNRVAAGRVVVIGAASAQVTASSPTTTAMPRAPRSRPMVRRSTPPTRRRACSPAAA